MAWELLKDWFLLRDLAYAVVFLSLLLNKKSHQEPQELHKFLRHRRGRRENHFIWLGFLATLVNDELIWGMLFFAIYFRVSTGLFPILVVQTLSPQWREAREFTEMIEPDPHLKRLRSQS